MADKCNNLEEKVFYGNSINGVIDYNTPFDIKGIIDRDIKEFNQIVPDYDTIKKNKVKSDIGDQEGNYDFYKWHMASKPLRRVTDIVKSFHKKDSFSEHETLKRALYSYAVNNNGDWSSLEYKEKKEYILRLYDKYNDDNLKDFKKEIDFIIKRYVKKGNSASDYGTKVHDIIEVYIIEREKFSKNSVSKTRTISELKDIHSVIEAALKRKDISKTSSEYSIFFDLLVNVEKQFALITKNYNITKIVPELALGNSVFGGSGDQYSGSGGKADISFFTDNGGIIILDTKTKERKLDASGNVLTDEYWNSKNFFTDRYINDGLNNFFDNKFNDAGIQTSIYGLMLEAKGYRMLENKVLYIDSEVTEEGEGNDIEFIYHTPKVNHENSTNLNDFRNDLKPILDPKGEVFKINKRIKGEISDVDTVIDFLTGGIKLSGGNTEKSVEWRYKVAKQYPNADDLGIQSDDSFGGKEEYYVEYGRNPETRGKKISIPKEYITDEKYIKGEIRKEVIYQSQYELNKMQTYLDYINGSNTSKLQSEERSTIDRMFSNMDPAYYTHKKAKDFPGLSDIDLPIIISEHKITGEIVINYISSGHRNGDVDTNTINTGFNRSNMFGNIFDDMGVHSGTLSTKYLLNTKENFKLLSSVFIATRIKQLNPNAKINFIQKTTSLKIDQEINVINMDTGIEYMKIFKKAIESESIDVPISGYIKDMFNDDSLFVKDNYKNDMVSPILSIINNGLESDSVINALSKLYGKPFNEFKDDLSKLILDDNYLSKGFYDPKIISKLEMIITAYKKAERDNDMKIMADPVFISTTRALHYMYGFKEVVNEHNSWISRNFVLQSNNPNHVMQHVSAIYQGKEIEAKRKITKYKVKLDKIKDQLAKQHGYSKWATVGKGSLTDIYKPMMANPDFNRDDSETMMRLIPAEKANTQVEKDFINIYNEIMLDSMESVMSDADFEKNKGGIVGWIPFYSRTSLTAKAEGTYKKRTTAEKIAGRTYKDILEGESKKFDYKVQSSLLNKWYSKDHNAGYDSNGEQSENWSENDIETNLEYVLGNAMHDGLMESLHTHTINAARNAMTVQQISEDMFGGSDEIKELERQLQSFIKQTIYGNTTSKSIANEIIRTTSTTATLGMLVSTRQLVLDSSTILFNGMSRSLASKIESIMHKNRDNDMTKVDPGSHAKAVALGIKNPKLFNAIGYEYGFINPDSDSIKEREGMRTMRGSLTNKFFAPNKFILDTGKTTMFIARMITDGSISAYDIDTDGRLSYDVKKDKRFYDKSGKELNPVLLKAVKLQMEKEGFGIENDEMIRGYTKKETNVIMSDIISFTGSFDKAGKALVSNIPLGQAMLKFKSFIIAKMGTYHRERSSTEEDYYGEFKKVYDNDGKLVNYEWTSYQREGIIQTLQGLSMKLMSAQRTMLIRDLSPIEKKNLSRLLSDMVIFGILFGLMSYVFMPDDEDDDNWLAKSALGQTLQKGMTNATMDVAFPIGLYSVTLSDDASLFAGISASLRIVKSAFGLVLLPFSDNVNIMEDTKSITGVNRSLWELYETWKWDEYNK